MAALCVTTLLAMISVSAAFLASPLPLHVQPQRPGLCAHTAADTFGLCAHTAADMMTRGTLAGLAMATTAGGSLDAGRELLTLRNAAQVQGQGLTGAGSPASGTTRTLMADAFQRKRWQMQENFMAELGATHAILWVRNGTHFEVAKDFTTEEKRRALRLARRDDKTFASESRKVKIPAEANGAIATAARSQREVVVKDFSKMVRVKLCREFGVKELHFVPLKSGSVLEYGTPGEEHVIFFKLLGQLVYNVMHSASKRAVFWLLWEIFLVLRMVVVIEGPQSMMKGIRNALGMLSEQTMAMEKNFGQDTGTATITRKFSLMRVLAAPAAVLLSAGLLRMHMCVHRNSYTSLCCTNDACMQVCVCMCAPHSCVKKYTDAGTLVVEKYTDWRRSQQERQKLVRLFSSIDDDQSGVCIGLCFVCLCPCARVRTCVRAYTFDRIHVHTKSRMHARTGILLIHRFCVRMCVRVCV